MLEACPTYDGARFDDVLESNTSHVHFLNDWVHFIYTSCEDSIMFYAFLVEY